MHRYFCVSLLALADENTQTGKVFVSDICVPCGLANPECVSL